MADLQFPWEAFMQAQQQKRQNQQRANEIIGQTLGSLGQDIGQGIQNRRMLQQQQQQKQQLQGLRNALVQLSQPKPQTVNFNGQNVPTASYNPITNQTTPNMNQPDQRVASIANLISKLPDQQLGQGVADLTQQMAKGSFGQTKPQASVFVNPNDATQVSPVPVPGWTEYKTTQGDALSKITGAAQAKARNTATSSRADAWNRSIDTKQINELTKKIGLSPAQQSSLQKNNLRADRAMQILSKPNITWQELALGEIDLAGIMQGGVPHVDEVKSTHFPGWQQQWSQWKTYATGHPDESVPGPIRQKVLNLVNDVVKIDNKFIDANKEFNTSMLAPTIRGGIDQFAPAINKMTNTLKSSPPQNSKATLRWNPQTQSLEPVQ